MPTEEMFNDSTPTSADMVPVGRYSAVDLKITAEVETSIETCFDTYMRKLEKGQLWLPVKNWGSGYSAKRLRDPARPTLYLVEYYGISSFLGNYGMGRTVKTLTLLPGETTKITTRTWKATSETISKGSSIIDSSNESTAQSFSEQLLDESSRSAEESKDKSWYVDGEVSQGWPGGKAQVNAGAEGAKHTGTEEFAKQVSDTVAEHTAQANASRETSVTESSESTQQTEDEFATERSFRNVNMRRVLNFVFRELNQEYITKTHLKEVRVAFSDGMPGSYREVPISGLRDLLHSKMQPEAADEIASQILALVAVTFDNDDEPVDTLEQVTMTDDGAGWTIRTVLPSQRPIEHPTKRRFYRYKRGPLGQNGSENPVEGVLLKQRTIVVRTDSVAVEALLGQADALDNYAMQMQEAAANKETLANERERLAHEIIRSLPPQDRVKAYAAFFGAISASESDSTTG
jgi:hypothetical protein